MVDAGMGGTHRCIHRAKSPWHIPIKADYRPTAGGRPNSKIRSQLVSRQKSGRLSLIARYVMQLFGSRAGIVRQNLQKRGKNEGNLAFPTTWRSGTFNR